MRALVAGRVLAAVLCLSFVHSVFKVREHGAVTVRDFGDPDALIGVGAAARSRPDVRQEGGSRGMKRPV